MRTIYRDIVSALIFSREGKLLLGMKHPDKGGVYSDCWHIPGGGVYENESKEAALHREVMEEVGLDITNYPPSLVDDSGTGESEKTLKDSGEKVLCKMKFNVYKVDIKDKDADQITIKLSDDLFTTVWVDLNDLSHYKLTPPSVSLFHKLGYLK